MEEAGHLTRGAVFVLALSLASTARAQVPGSSQSNPFVESSSGRALQRLFFGAIDCGPGFSEAVAFCPDDAFSQSGLFGNGTYGEIRFTFAGAALGAPNTAEILPSVAGQLTTFPSASSATGFTYSWRNAAIPTRDSEVFGALFGEQAVTNGRHQLSFSLNYQQLSFSRLDGQDTGLDSAGVFVGDSNYADFGDGPAGYVALLKLDFMQRIATAGITFGVTDRLDVRAMAPIIWSRVEGSNEFLDFVEQPDGAVTIDPGVTFFFPQGRYFVTGESSGLGDVELGVKFAAIDSARWNVALSGGARLGTGSRDKLTGTGATKGQAAIACSLESKALTPFVWARYTSGGGEAPELIGSLSLAVPIGRDRVTIAGELVGRRIFDARILERGETVKALVTSPVTGDVFEVRDYSAGRADIDSAFAVAGIKVRVLRQLVGSAFVTIPLLEEQLQPGASGSFGLSYVF